MRKMLLATASAVALITVAAAPALAQDGEDAEVKIIVPEGTTVEQQSTQSVGEQTRDAAEATGETVEDAADATADAADDAADAAGDAARATGEALEDAADATAEATRDAAQTAERAVEDADETEARTAREFNLDDVETTVPAGSYLSTDLMDEAVQTPDGENIADSEAFVITPEGQITHMVIGFGGFLGLGEKRVMLPWEAFSISGDDSTRFTVNLTKEQVEALPEFEATQAGPEQVRAPADEAAPRAN